ncbi:MAG: type VI secretion protein ImpB, partial [Alphaproteobacteria bacterium]|nr:type VI secretion protein ImpB [Alphaproteobacteria bacterium]
MLPPDQRSLADARAIARLLLTKAARRTRRDNFYATNLYLWLRGYERGWGEILALPQVNDDYAVLAGFNALWARLTPILPPRIQILRVGVTLG